MSRCSSVGNRPDVDEPNTTDAPAARLALASIACLRASRSGALSCTKSAPATASSGLATKRSAPSADSGTSVRRS